MGEHSAPDEGWLARAYDAWGWLVDNRRKIYAALLVVIPLLSRYWPDFPSDALMDTARLFLGA